MCVMRRPDPLDELLTYNDEAIKKELDRIASMSASERGETVPIVAVDTLPVDGADSEFTGEYAVAIQSSVLKPADVANLTTDVEEVIKDFQDKATKAVSQSIRLIDGSLSDKEVLQQLRMSHVGKFDSSTLKDETVVILYDVKSSGEQARRPMLRPPAFRKQHIDRLLPMALLSREPETKKPEDGDDEEVTIRPKEVVVLLDAFREGNASSLLSSVKLGDQAQPAATLGC